MKIGHLGIPIIQPSQTNYFDTISTRLYKTYSRVLKDRSKLLESFQSDSRVKALSGKMISRGHGETRFDVKQLAMWFLWATNEYGQQTAEIGLDKFLNSEKLPMENAGWILGVEVDKAINLDNGITIIGIDDMPNSIDKERYTILHHNSVTFPMPKTAIVQRVEIQKIMDYSNPNLLRENEALDISENNIRLVSRLLNTINGVSCWLFQLKTYSLPNMPMGMFTDNHYTNIFSQNHVINNSYSKLTSSSVVELNNLLPAFKNLPKIDRGRISRSIHWLYQAKQRRSIIELCIALEMVLLEGIKHEKIRETIKNRGAKLLQIGNPNKKDHYYKSLNDIYEIRTQLVHSGSIEREFEDKATNNFDEYISLAEEILKKLILDGKPDWSKL